MSLLAGYATRRGFLRRSAGVALGAAGLLRLVDAVALPPTRAAAAVGARAPAEQHLLRNVRVLTDNGIEIFAPPLHHQLVTAKLGVAPTKAALRAQPGASSSRCCASSTRASRRPPPAWA